MTAHSQQGRVELQDVNISGEIWYPVTVDVIQMPTLNQERLVRPTQLALAAHAVTHNSIRYMPRCQK